MMPLLVQLRDLYQPKVRHALAFNDDHEGEIFASALRQWPCLACSRTDRQKRSQDLLRAAQGESAAARLSAILYTGNSERMVMLQGSGLNRSV
eukprot:4619951-Pleurochrysis_carterae.AAC.2